MSEMIIKSAPERLTAIHALLESWDLHIIRTFERLREIVESGQASRLDEFTISPVVEANAMAVAAHNLRHTLQHMEGRTAEDIITRLEDVYRPHIIRVGGHSDSLVGHALQRAEHLFTYQIIDIICGLTWGARKLP